MSVENIKVCHPVSRKERAAECAMESAKIQC